MAGTHSLGLDFGTNSVRALIVDTASGEEVGSAVAEYARGEEGIILDQKNPDLARQHPRDYAESMVGAIRGALGEANGAGAFAADSIVGIGVDATGSTPLPVDKEGIALAMRDGFSANPAAMAWLWKDHTAHAEAREITELAKEKRPQFLAKCGGIYSSEWFWAKILHCRRTAPDVFEAAHTWVELSDFVPAMLTGQSQPGELKRNICAAGHKAMFHPDWGGYPDKAFLAGLDQGLVRVRRTLHGQAFHIGEKVGVLNKEWAERLGLPGGIPVAAGALDAHLGAVGSGVRPGVLAKVIGTSGCDMMVASMESALPDIPGLCGIVPESILPGFYGLEAGQSAVGDLFNWLVGVIGPHELSHEDLTRQAARLKPGESGLLSLDWHNGNRTVLVDQRLTGMLVGLTLRSTPAEIYRALIEAAGFGARAIIERLEEYGVPVEALVTCGGISVKNPLLMQIYSDILNRPMQVSRSEQTCALGSAMAGAVIGGAHADFGSATAAMTAVREKQYQPNPKSAAVYERLFALYRELHDAFGIQGHQAELYPVMKELLAIRDEQKK